MQLNVQYTPRHFQALERNERKVIESMQRTTPAWQIPAPKRQPVKPTNIIRRLFGI